MSLGSHIHSIYISPKTGERVHSISPAYVMRKFMFLRKIEAVGHRNNSDTTIWTQWIPSWKFCEGHVNEDCPEPWGSLHRREE